MFLILKILITTAPIFFSFKMVLIKYVDNSKQQQSLFFLFVTEVREKRIVHVNDMFLSKPHSDKICKIL